MSHYKRVEKTRSLNFQEIKELQHKLIMKQRDNHIIISNSSDTSSRERFKAMETHYMKGK